MNKKTMLTKVEVKGLFGAFNHTVKFNQGNITLILGENGLGKTIILKMIKSFFEKSFFDLQSVVFSDFHLWFNDNKEVVIKRTENEDECKLVFKLIEKKKALGSYTLTFSEEDKHHSRKLKRYHYDYDYYSHGLRHELRHFIPAPIEQMGPDTWMDRSTNMIYQTRDLLEKYSKYLPPHLRKEIDKGIPDWLVKRTDNLKIKLIETQRLLTQIKSDEGKYHSSVERYSKELIETIKNKTVEATDLSSKLDRTYPNRLTKKITDKKTMTDIELENGLKALDEKRELLKRVGLVDASDEYIQPISDEIKKRTGQNKEILKDVLQVYLEDSNDKLAVYNDLATKIDLLLKIINDRFLFKKLSIDKTKGFVFTSTSSRKKDIPLSGLSSGEQHELVLFFQLLFNTEPNSLLLIDEPEISLHISWQKLFIDDLKEVIKLTNLFVLIATHSPDIIGNYWDLTETLKGE